MPLGNVLLPGYFARLVWIAAVFAREFDVGACLAVSGCLSLVALAGLSLPESVRGAPAGDCRPL